MDEAHPTSSQEDRDIEFVIRRFNPDDSHNSNKNFQIIESSLEENFIINENNKVIPSMGNLLHIHRITGDEPAEAMRKVLMHYPNQSLHDITQDYQRHLSNIDNPTDFDKNERHIVNDFLDNNLPNKMANIVIKPVRVCDNCNKIDPLINNKFNPSWASYDNEDYCADCHNDCENCECETNFANPDHLINCKADNNGGNCACPPCGCDCHR